MDLFSSLNHWHWLTIGVILLILELTTGGGFLLWIGISALTVGLLIVVMPFFHWPMQLLLFACISVISCVLWWWYLRRHPEETDQPTLNLRSEQYVGRVLTLEVDIINGRGKVKIGDSLWRVIGEDMPAGTKVKVTNAEGVLLHVVKVEVH
jgi:membrane protein implicated in regulation of membrane protease activity